MKLHFEPNLDFQHDAIEAVCDLFKGQETCRTEFTVTADFEQRRALERQPGFKFEDSDLGIGNRLHLLDEEILANLGEVQLRNGLRPSSSLASRDFTVEMETGTGKTYVYLRTIFELNRRYGFTKFVIVVPSVAIKEGVYKTLQITEEHFRALYANVPFDYFLYDSAKLGQVRNFATSPNIQIMVVTVGAINKKDVNNLYKDSEKTGGEKPIDLIRATQPILIVDEPQSVDGVRTMAADTVIPSNSPLCSSLNGLHLTTCAGTSLPRISTRSAKSELTHGGAQRPSIRATRSPGVPMVSLPLMMPRCSGAVIILRLSIENRSAKESWVSTAGRAENWLTINNGNKKTDFFIRSTSQFYFHLLKWRWIPTGRHPQKLEIGRDRLRRGDREGRTGGNRRPTSGWLLGEPSTSAP
jgi:hypothetical protein